MRLCSTTCLYYGNSDKVTRSWSFRTGLFPTQDLVDCYLQKDEADDKWKHWWETKQARDLNIAVTTDKDGNKRTSFDVVADNVEFCESKNSGNSTYANTINTINTVDSNSGNNGNSDEFVDIPNDEDLPF